MSWFGHQASTLEQRLGLPKVIAELSVTSTMDVAHALASAGTVAGCPAGTLVLAEAQQVGRGRAGNRWNSAPRAGIWATLIERPGDPAALQVLSLRIGLRLAPVLERWTAGPIRLKWPNDLFVGDAKLAGVLIEARWRDQRPDWVAIGVGINLVAPMGEPAMAALAGADALAVLAELIPALRAAACARGPLDTRELAEFAARDLTVGRRISAPAEGTARGITADGALLVESTAGLSPHRVGSLVLAS